MRLEQSRTWSAVFSVQFATGSTPRLFPGGDVIVKMEIEFPCPSTSQIEPRQTGRVALVVVHLFETPAEVSGFSGETVFSENCACRDSFPELLHTLPAAP